MKYSPPIGAPNPTDPYIDGNPGAGTEGSAVPAAPFNELQLEIQNVILAADIVPEHEDTAQLLEALLVIIEENAPELPPIPDDIFSKRLLHVQDQKPNGTAGGATVAGATATRTLNTVLTNEIAGSSLSSNQITLPAGQYYIAANAPVFSLTNLADCKHKAKLYNVTSGANLVIGTSENAGGDCVTRSMVNGRFTLAATSQLEIRHFTQNPRSFGDAVSSGDIEVYTDVKIWKVA